MENADELVDLNFGDWELNYSSDDVFFSLIKAKGWGYQKFVKDLCSWKATMRDVMKFNRKDFELVGNGESPNAIRRGVLRLINAHRNESKIEGNCIRTAIRASIESVVKETISMSGIVDVIFGYIKYYEDIRSLNPTEVSNKLSSCHDIFEKYALYLQV